MLGHNDGLSESEAARKIVDEARHFVQVRPTAFTQMKSVSKANPQQTQNYLAETISISEKKTVQLRL